MILNHIGIPTTDQFEGEHPAVRPPLVLALIELEHNVHRIVRVGSPFLE